MCSVLVVRWSYDNDNVNDSAAKPNKNYDNVTLASVTESTIKMDYNPSYGIIDKYGNAVKMDRLQSIL